MARVPLSKAQLARERQTLVQVNRFLPALDLKRQQLMGERNRARQDLARLRQEFKALVDTIGEDLPMLADRRIDLSGLARLTSIKHGTQNIAGVRVPTIESVEVEVAPFSLFVRPHWVDAAAERLRDAIRARLELDVMEQRIAALDKAVMRTAQRVNLFEKVLAPQAKENIKRIMIALGDAERASVVSAKISKRKREAATAALAARGATA